MATQAKVIGLQSVEADESVHLVELLGAIADQKNAALGRIDWIYPTEDPWYNTALDKAIELANARAARIAKGLGVELIGVWSFEDRYTSDEDDQLPRAVFGKEDRPPHLRSRQIDLGTEIRHFKEVRLTVNVEYRISGL